MAPECVPAPLRYRLGMERPHSHLFQVQLQLPLLMEEELELAMPAWTPGAYKLVDNARNVRDMKVTDEQGARVAYERVDLHTWRVFPRGRSLTLRYQVYGDKMNIHQAQLNARHAFVNGCAVFLYAVGHNHDWGAELEVVAPIGWRVATALEEIAPLRYAAPSFDDLIDSPLEIGTFEEAGFREGEQDYRIIWQGPEPMDSETLIDGLRRLVQAETGFWPEVPYRKYTFIYNVTQDSYLNGLEHKASTAIQGPIDLLGNAKSFFALTAHELFHVWNVKRIRPVGLGPFDYRKPAHTTALWIAEGLTEFYTERMCLRADVTSGDEFLKSLTDNLRVLEQSPGRKFTTLAEASMVTWNFGDDRWNGYINYYVKGALLGAALDLELRTRTANRRSLDDLMLQLWERYGAPDVAYRPEDVERLAEELAGSSLQALFDLHLRSTEDADWRAIFALAGLDLVVTHETPTLGLRTVTKDGAVTIDDVRALGPADACGLQAGDVLLSLGDRRCHDSLLTRLDQLHRPGETLNVRFYRSEQICETPLTLGSDRRYALVAAPDASALQQEIRASWLRAGRTAGDLAMATR